MLGCWDECVVDAFILVQGDIFSQREVGKGVHLVGIPKAFVFGWHPQGICLYATWCLLLDDHNNQYPPPQILIVSLPSHLEIISEVQKNIYFIVLWNI